MESASRPIWLHPFRRSDSQNSDLVNANGRAALVRSERGISGAQRREHGINPPPAFCPPQPRCRARVSSGVSRRAATIIVAGKRALAAAGNNSGAASRRISKRKPRAILSAPVFRRARSNSPPSSLPPSPPSPPAPSLEYRCAAPYVRSYV